MQVSSDLEAFLREHADDMEGRCLTAQSLRRIMAPHEGTIALQHPISHRQIASIRLTPPAAAGETLGCEGSTLLFGLLEIAAAKLVARALFKVFDRLDCGRSYTKDIAFVATELGYGGGVGAALGRRWQAQHVTFQDLTRCVLRRHGAHAVLAAHTPPALSVLGIELVLGSQAALSQGGQDVAQESHRAAVAFLQTAMPDCTDAERAVVRESDLLQLSKRLGLAMAAKTARSIVYKCSADGSGIAFPQLSEALRPLHASTLQKSGQALCVLVLVELAQRCEVLPTLFRSQSLTVWLCVLVGYACRASLLASVGKGIRTAL